MKNFLYIASALLFSSVAFAASNSMPAKIQLDIYKQELEYINNLMKKGQPVQKIEQEYKKHLQDKKIQSGQATDIHSPSVFYRHLQELLIVKGGLINFKAWLEGQIRGMSTMINGGH